MAFVLDRDHSNITINSCSCWLNQYHRHQMSLNNRLCKVSTFKTIYMTTDALSSTCDIPRQQTSPRTQRRQRQTSQAWSRCSLLAWTRNVMELCSEMILLDSVSSCEVRERNLLLCHVVGKLLFVLSTHSLQMFLFHLFFFQVDLTCKKSLVKKWLQMFPAR